MRRRVAAGKMRLRIRDLRNLGPRTEALLARIGIDTVEKLRRVGGLEAYWRLRRQHARLSRNTLWALIGALEPWPEGRHWREVATGPDRLGLMLAIESRERARAQVLQAAERAAPSSGSARGSGRAQRRRQRAAAATDTALDPRAMLLPALRTAHGKRGR
ncbi:MAG: TfoX/Sxy family protein [Gammaproteobacteria bacterium]|nr:TfoX/Sxy family protein [Gammaproteobacteria bacterium]